MGHGFLSVISRAEFQSLLASFPCQGTETVPLDRAAGRVLAQSPVAPENLPPHHRSCMDGYAVAARDTFGASESNPAYLEFGFEIVIERAPDQPLEPGKCAAIPTGGWLPQGADAVVMVEHTEPSGDLVEIRKSVAPGENVMFPGEDAKAGEPILRTGRVLRSQEIGLLAALGLGSAEVGKQPRVGLLSTGNELVEYSDTPDPGQMRDVNRPTLAALVAEAGGVVVDLGLAPDNKEALAKALRQGADQCDMVLLSGGSSIGTRDLSVTVIQELGGEILAHGVALSPGKPTILARLNGIPVLGLPGQVASALVVAHVLAAPLVLHLAGAADAFARPWRPVVRAELARNMASKPGREDWVRVALEERPGENPLAGPVTGKSGLLFTMLKADGLAVLPADSEGGYAGDMVEVMLL